MALGSTVHKPLSRLKRKRFGQYDSDVKNSTRAVMATEKRQRPHLRRPRVGLTFTMLFSRPRGRDIGE